MATVLRTYRALGGLAAAMLLFGCAPSTPTPQNPARATLAPTALATVSPSDTPIVIVVGQTPRVAAPTPVPEPTLAYPVPIAPVALSAVVDRISVAQRSIAFEEALGDITHLEIQADATVMTNLGDQVPVSSIVPGSRVQAWGSLDTPTTLTAIQIVVTLPE